MTGTSTGPSAQAKDHASAGAALAEEHSLPYHPVLKQKPPSEARRHLSFTCAQAWGAIPVAYDADGQELTIVVSTGARARRIQQTFSLLLQAPALRFRVASADEVAAALRTHFGEGSDGARAWADRPSALSTVAATQRKRMPAPPQTADNEEVPAPSAAAVPDATSAPTGEDARAVNMAVDALCEATLLDDAPDILAQIRTRTRYCHLLATRLQLDEAHIEDTDLTARVSALQEHAPHIVQRLSIPTRITGYLVEAQTPPTLEANAEALLVRLVRCYQELAESGYTDAGDVLTTRLALGRAVGLPAALDVVLETFLQVLMDEDFLTDDAGQRGSVLILDPRESTDGRIERAVSRDGYSSVTRGGIEGLLDADRHDALIVALGLANNDPDDLLLALKEVSDAPPPLIVVLETDDPVLEARCVRAGVNAALTSPVHPDLLSATLERVCAAPAPAPSDGGVTGSLDDMSFTDVIQILSAGNRSVRMTLGELGEVYLEEGRVVHASCGGITGEAAFYELMRCARGEFHTLTCHDFAERSIEAPTMSLLMEGARLLDEAAEAEEA